ncbi:MAG: transposase, partial [Wolbachia endosymbiont of Alcedoecus sp.]|nr:transposase [Wolbachia endosymbiont of Alcedoecus sp.]
MDLYKEEAILEYKLEEGMRKGMEKGMKKGREEGKIEVAKAILANNVDVETIAKFTSFSVSEIKELSENQ